MCLYSQLKVLGKDESDKSYIIKKFVKLLYSSLFYIFRFKMKGSKVIYFLSLLFTFWKSDVVKASMLPDNCGRTPMYLKPQIYGGYSIAPDEFGWLASLQYGNKSTYRMCGGSVIDSRHVLTAAHCVPTNTVSSCHQSIWEVVSSSAYPKNKIILFSS